MKIHEDSMRLTSKVDFCNLKRGQCFESEGRTLMKIEIASKGEPGSGLHGWVDLLTGLCFCGEIPVNGLLPNATVFRGDVIRNG